MVVLLAALVLAAPGPPAKSRAKKPPVAPAAAAATQKPPLCEADYADAVPTAIASQVLDGVREQFVFSIRNTATYEHVYYGRDGKLRRSYVRSVVHGTAFAYQVKDGETLLADLVAIGESAIKRGWHMNSVSYPNFRSWQAQNRTLTNIGVYSGTSFNMASGDGAEFIQGASKAFHGEILVGSDLKTITRDGDNNASTSNQQDGINAKNYN